MTELIVESSSAFMALYLKARLRNLGFYTEIFIEQKTQVLVVTAAPQNLVDRLKSEVEGELENWSMRLK